MADRHLANIDLAIDAAAEGVDSCHNSNAADQLPVLWMASSDSDALWWSLAKLAMRLWRETLLKAERIKYTALAVLDVDVDFHLMTSDSYHSWKND